MLSAVAGVALDWSLLGLAFIILLIRLYIRWWLQHRLSLNDATICAAFIFFAYVVSVDTFNWKLGFLGGPRDIQKYENPPQVDSRKDQDLIIFLKLFYIGGPMYYTSLWCIKANFILLYYKLVSSELKKLRWLLHTVAVTTAASWVAVVVLNTCYCIPVTRNWTLKQSDLCLTYVKYPVYFITVALHLFTDILVFAFPFSLLRVLVLNRKSKISIIIMFTLGLLCISCTIGRIVSVGTSFQSTAIGVWASAEMSSGVIVSCLPTLKMLLTQKKLERGSFFPRDTEILSIEGAQSVHPRMLGTEVAMTTIDTDKSTEDEVEGTVGTVDAWMIHKTIESTDDCFSSPVTPTLPMLPIPAFFQDRAINSVGGARRSFDPRDFDELEPPMLLNRPRLPSITIEDADEAGPSNYQTIDHEQIGLAIGHAL